MVSCGFQVANQYYWPACSPRASCQIATPPPTFSRSSFHPTAVNVTCSRCHQQLRIPRRTLADRVFWPAPSTWQGLRLGKQRIPRPHRFVTTTILTTGDSFTSPSGRSDVEAVGQTRTSRPNRIDGRKRLEVASPPISTPSRGIHLLPTPRSDDSSPLSQPALIAGGPCQAGGSAS